MASTMKTNSYTHGLSEYCLTAVYLLYVYKGFYSKLNRKCCHENHELSRCLQNKGLPCDKGKVIYSGRTTFPLFCNL